MANGSYKVAIMGTQLKSTKKLALLCWFLSQLDNPLKSYRHFCDVIDFHAILTL